MKNQTTTTNLPHVVIVGAGFGGLRVVRRLAKQPVRVTLIDRHNYHLFQPLLYQVASAGVSPAEIAYPLRSFLRKQQNAEFVLAEVNGVNLADRKVITSVGEIIYDSLILAAGGQSNFFGLESVARSSFGLKDLAEASALRDHLLRLFERASQVSDPQARRALLTFVVAGGGPTGVEMSGAIAELIRLVISKDFPHHDFSVARVLLLEAAGRLLPAMPAELSQATLEALTRKGVEVRFGTAVKEFDRRQVTLANKEVIDAHTLIWAAGIRAQALYDSLEVEQAAQGRVRVTPTLQLPDHPEVFVIGDGAYLEDERGKPLPMVAPVAMQQADYAAANLGRLHAGLPLQAFRYRDPGLMATIGRNQAVARLGRFNFRGFLAWLIWVVVHIFQLIGFRNRLVVMINWAWDYFLYDRALRFIGSEAEGSSPDAVHPAGGKTRAGRSTV